MSILELRPTSHKADLVTSVDKTGQAVAFRPVVGRVAGLPAQAIDVLDSPACSTLLHSRYPILQELQASRETLICKIEETLTQFDKKTRRFLLAVKRDCYNHRRIGKYRKRQEWACLQQLAPEIVEHIPALENELAEQEQLFTELYKFERNREREYLVRFCDASRFIRGMAIGRSVLVQKMRSKVPALVASGFSKPMAKWEETLLRFVTRAATKLSANSTLTTYRLGNIQSIAQPAFQVGDAAHEETSLVRVDRPELEQLQTLLLKHPSIRRQALVMWNDTIQEHKSGKVRFLRTGFWQIDPISGTFDYVDPVRIKVQLSNPLLGATRQALEKAPLPYHQLLASLRDQRLVEESKVKAALEHLLSLGLLLLVPPWPTHEPCLERRLHHFLQSTAEKDRELQGVADATAKLLSLQNRFPLAPRPEDVVSDMENAFARLMTAAASLSGSSDRVISRPTFYEDVLEVPKPRSASSGFIFQSAAASEVLNVVRLVARFDSLFNLRHDFQHALAVWWRENDPDRSSMPFEELAKCFGPVWARFLKFSDTAREVPLSTFEPDSSPALETLHKLRRSIIAEAKKLAGASAGQDFIASGELAELLETLPDRYAPIVGSSVFFQPANADASLWVLNNVTEGTGRYLSRVTPILQGSERKAFLYHLNQRSVIEVDGEEADLLEVMYPWIHLVRAHPPQAQKVLELRGLHLDLPSERRVRLEELVVEADLKTERFCLRDRSGRRVLPASLSTIPDARMPNLLRLLMMFGPGETRGVFPFSWSEKRGEVTRRHRLTCDQVVLRRGGWTVEIEELREQLQNASDDRAYALVHQWRQRLGLPKEGFYHELSSSGKIKPQFVRFTSPSLCRLFVSSLRKMKSETVHITEALPSPAEFPIDASSGERRGFEVLIDQLAIHEPEKPLRWSHQPREIQSLVQP